jgi:hypothetical protein
MNFQSIREKVVAEHPDRPEEKRRKALPSTELRGESYVRDEYPRSSLPQPSQDTDLPVRRYEGFSPFNGRRSLPAEDPTRLPAEELYHKSAAGAARWRASPAPAPSPATPDVIRRELMDIESRRGMSDADYQRYLDNRQWEERRERERERQRERDRELDRERERERDRDNRKSNGSNGHRVSSGWATTGGGMEDQTLTFSINESSTPGGSVSDFRKGKKRELTREQREHAAAVRKLGACPDCKARKVRCSPSHHRTREMSIGSRSGSGGSGGRGRSRSPRREEREPESPKSPTALVFGISSREMEGGSPSPEPNPPAPAAARTPSIPSIPTIATVNSNAASNVKALERNVVVHRAEPEEDKEPDLDVVGRRDPSPQGEPELVVSIEEGERGVAKREEEEEGEPLLVVSADRD